MLKIKPPYAPMEALSVPEIPSGPQWQYEPKWDGFRCLAFRDGKKVELQSKAQRPLTRYFPELVEALSLLKLKQFVLDGEIVVADGKKHSFDDLLQRIHPAASRVKKLAAERPAMFVIFDLLADAQGRSLVKKPLKERRALLEGFARQYLNGHKRLRMSPATTSLREAKKWFNAVGASLDGLIAKRVDLEYRSGDRSGMQKIKRLRTADCVVGGFRYGTNSKLAGSLLLGLYDKSGLLNHVGFCSGIKAAERKALTKRLEALIETPGFTGRAPGGPSRWSTGRSSEWQPLVPKLVAEVSFDHVTGDRFRHGTRFVRWRPDKLPKQCTFEQLKQTKTGS